MFVATCQQNGSANLTNKYLEECEEETEGRKIFANYVQMEQSSFSLENFQCEIDTKFVQFGLVWCGSIGFGVVQLNPVSVVACHASHHRIHSTLSNGLLNFNHIWFPMWLIPVKSLFIALCERVCVCQWWHALLRLWHHRVHTTTCFSIRMNISNNDVIILHIFSILLTTANQPTNLKLIAIV